MNLSAVTTVRCQLFLGFVTIAFHLWLVFSGLIPNLVSRPLHLALAMPWIFLWPSSQADDSQQSYWFRLSGLLLCTVGMLMCLGIAVRHDALGDQYGFLSGQFQVLLAGLILLVVLELARRAIGWPLPLVASAALAYGFFGSYIPGEFGFTAIPVNSFLGTLTIAEGGLWGKLTGISVNIIAVFVILGAVLNAGAAGSGFMNLATATGGRLRGGAAKVSVISSALFGSISGSASANVASTGAITIPAMNKLGYPRALSAATEAVASSGGQIMPPLMGAGAFVMVELTGIPYTDILMAALLPALLYFIVVWQGINAFSQRFDLKPVCADLIPPLKVVLFTAGFFAIPFTVLLLGMFAASLTPQYAASLAILAAALLLVTDEAFGFSFKAIRERLATACIQAGRQVATIAAIIACASIIIGVLGLTGLGVKITSLILSGSGGQLWLALLLTAAACLLLGMEVPTTAAYVICISIAGPALIELGLKPLQAHLFVFWYALLSTITPPVCGAVFIAAGISSVNWLKVALFAMALGVGLYLIPVVMIVTPVILASKTTPLLAILVFLKSLAALWLMVNAIIAPHLWVRRVVQGLAGLGILLLPFTT